MYSFGYRVVRTILTILGGKLKIENKNKIPSSPYIVVCTHTTWFDIIYLAFSLWPTPIHYMAKQELFTFKPIKYLLTKLNAFPVNRDNPGPSSLKIPLKLLKNNKVVGIFPTGTRTIEQASLKRGAVTIAMKSGVPILPAIYKGPLTFKELLQRKEIVVRFGEPITFEQGISTNKETIDQKTQEMKHIFDELEANN
ncbi:MULTISPECIES: lysophospholipid acyltransferase family protein [Heyndrickxia]|uniref:lysophospholipid acyltransferase family protein n=1 Tax=Heyndrickxia TaxID=2837504 RepID=UPI001B2754E3|nr:1-acyl-sn-glycerol-3-phosphate acyltransferase [Heyndrickxia oleronia]GIN37382.1 1-acyl-sn-glycerol-3-phosphate acyltransferase [Heyndrickxia oleronia]